MTNKQEIAKPNLNLPDYPIEPEPAPRAHGDLKAIYDPLSYLSHYQYEKILFSKIENWVLTINTSVAFFVIHNEHKRFMYPVATGQKQDEKWYYIKNELGPHRLYIATQRDAYKVYSSCHVEVYDTNINFLGKAGEEIKIDNDKNYFIRTYGIGEYHLYIAREIAKF